MPGDDKSSRHPAELGKGAIWRPLLTCLGGAAFLFLLRYAFANMPPLLNEILTHVGIAFLVAAVLLATLEFNAKQLLHREVLRFLAEVAKDVYNALLERIVPKEIFNEINDILRTEVIRRECEYVITFAHPYPQMPSDYFIIRRALTFTVENQLNKSTTFIVRSIYSGDVKAGSPAWRGVGSNFHSRLEVDGVVIPLAVGRNLFEKKNGLIVLEHPIHLEPHGSARVLLKGEEPYRIAASRNSYIQGTPVIGLRVSIDNEYPEVIGSSSVQMHHPAREKMTYIQERYDLDHAFFPGQGFEICWETVQSVEAPGGRVSDVPTC